MIGKTFILAAVTLAAAGVAAAPAAFAACDWTNPQSFVDTIQVLDQNYVLHPPGTGGYVPPSGVLLRDLNLPADSPILQDLRNAFRNAPPTFRQKLCGSAGVIPITGIFISTFRCMGSDPTRCDHTSGGQNFNRAWGFRSFDSSDRGATYIAIAAADLWWAGSQARTLSDYETEMLRSFRGWNGATVAPAVPNDSWMSVLAAMAHEVGHVRWAETTIPNPVPGNNPYDLSLLTDCPFGDFFVGWRYLDSADLVPPNRWRPFLNRSAASGRLIDHGDPPFLRGPFGLDNPLTANADLWSLYQPNQPWASLFAAQVPDEDFVESYVMAVLTGYDPIANRFTGPLTSMPLNAGYSPFPDVARDLVTGQKPALQAKIACVPL